MGCGVRDGTFGSPAGGFSFGVLFGSQVSYFLFALPILCAPILEPNLNSSLAQVQFHGETFALNYIRIVDYLERFLQVV